MNQHLHQRIKDAAHRTYAIIAPDLFRVTEDNTLTQTEVIQYVGRYIEYAKDPEAERAFNAMPEVDKTTLLQKVFPEKTYHWEPAPSPETSTGITVDNLQERIETAANRTWQAIGGDILTAAQVNTMPADEVAQCVGDSDYLERFGNAPDAVAAFRELSYEQRNAMLRNAFPHKDYGR